MSAATKPNAQPNKKFKAKQFRVAVEGATTDGRNIERAWIEQMARNYKPATYGARVNIEHLRSLAPDSTWRSYGDVLALEAKQVTEGDLKGKLALYATIEPLPDLVEMTTKLKQKVFTSIEVNPKFADTGEAYLMGIAVTDTPASLGTEMLSFCAQQPADKNPLASRKTSPDCLFTAAELVEGFGFEEEAEDTAAKFGDTLKALVARFTGRGKATDEGFAAVTEALEQITGHVTEQFKTLQDQAKAQADQAKADRERIEKLSTDLTELRTLLDGTDRSQHSQRPPATGGAGEAKAEF